MTIELIPVLEIGYSDQEGVNIPYKYPYWENAPLWGVYRKECLKKAGFTDQLIPYLEGAPFYLLADISDEDLARLIVNHTQRFRKGEYEREESSPLFGGYVLRVNGQDKYFPQCCGDLSDIQYWRHLSLGNNSPCEGHPSPVVEIENDKISLDFTVDEFDERFDPIPPETILTIERLALGKAVQNAEKQLVILEERLRHINAKENLHIERIEDLLIWYR